MSTKHNNDDTQWIIDSDGSLTPIPEGICQCGCGRPTTPWIETRPSRGQVRGRFKRFVPSHRVALLDRFEVNPVTGCWLWLLSTDEGGYGKVSHPLTRQAHRLFYVKIVGPVPDNCDLDHRCRVRRCVNPHHLEPVMRVENVRRGLSTTLTEEQARKAVELIGKVPYTDIASRLGVSKSAIVHIANGRTWPELGGKEVPRQTGRWTIRGKKRTNTSLVLMAV